MNNNLEQKFYTYTSPSAHLEAAMALGLSQKQKKLADCFDMITFHYKRYLLDISKTLHRVMFEIRRYRNLDNNYIEGLNVVLEQVEDQIMDLEYYELMDKYNSSKKVILSKIHKEAI